MLIADKDRNDNEVVRKLVIEAEKYSLEEHKNERLECYLMLSNMTSLWLMQTTGISSDLYHKVDVFATTPEDFMAKSIFVKLPNIQSPYPALDRKPIDINSETTIHLVIFGKNDLAEALAINAALVAHYPNYCRDHHLRTRISIVADDIFSWRDLLVQRYQHLFANSYYRTINLEEEIPECFYHQPMYGKTREDFVDVEWEFVNGNLRNDALRMKLEEWSESERQQLTVAICMEDQQRNFIEAFTLPEVLYKNQIPVLCYTEESDMMDLMRNDDRYQSVFPFGSYICQMGILESLKQLAKRVNYVYDYCFSLPQNVPISSPSVIDERKLDNQWTQVGSLPKQYSNIFNAMTIGSKMHSLGHGQEDWQRYYALSKQEIEIMTEVEHNRWNIEELILGYRPVTDEEQKMIENDISLKKKFRGNKIHYDIRAFHDLRPDATGKQVYVYDLALTQGIPLIVKSCFQ